MKVLFFSLNLTSKNKCVAEGTLASRYVVGRNMLGEQYLAVFFSRNERLVRPYEKFQTVGDVIGHVIAWPLSHVSTLPYNHQLCSNVHT